MSNVVASVIQSGIQKAVAAASLHLTTETRDEFLGPVLSKFTKTGTGKSLVELAALADGMRVVFETLLADGKITSQEIEVSKSFISKVAAQLGKVRSQYSSFQNGSEFEIMPFLKQYREDTGTFGYKDESTRWSGLKVCANIAKKTGDDIPFNVLRTALLQGVRELLQADGVEQKEKEYFENLQKQINQVKLGNQNNNLISSVSSDTLKSVHSDFEDLQLNNQNGSEEWLKKNLRKIKSWKTAAEENDPRGQHLLGLCYHFGLGVSENKLEAAKWYRKAAEQGLARAQLNLGVCYHIGEGVEEDKEEAVKWYRLAAEQGDARAQLSLGGCYDNGDGVEEDKEEAANWLRKAALQGETIAQFNLGVCYDQGEGVEEDKEEAVKWYRLAAEQGDARAQLSLGGCYDNGEGVEEDKEEAVNWYRKAAEQGETKAQFNLGVCYDQGEGVEEDKEEAVKWYRLAADQGNTNAQRNLGIIYHNGDVVPRDKAEAEKWFRLAVKNGDAFALEIMGDLGYPTDDLAGTSDDDFDSDSEYEDKDASDSTTLWRPRMNQMKFDEDEDASDSAEQYRESAEQGDAEAQLNLGLCYYNGEGVEEDKEEAVIWFRKAAEQGEATAQLNLGVCYGNGEGVEEDKEEAVIWWRKAAEQGEAFAQSNLGVAYYRGEGVEEDKEEAVIWWRKAAEQGDARSQYALGVCYYNGEGVEEDKEEAVKWYRKAAEQGEAQAQLKLGDCYDQGEGVEEDKEEAVIWWRKAAEQGEAGAQLNLGMNYYDGEGVEEDKEEAVIWFRKAAEQGDARAQYALGLSYYNGEGVEEDKEEAVIWWRKAAVQDEPYALLNLGVCYVNGEGVEEDKKEAVKCWRKAAEIGCEEAWDILERFFDGLLKRSTTSDLPPIFKQNEIPESQLTDPPGTIINSLGMKLVPIKAGTFLMGGREDEEGYNEEEEQLHTVQITKPYYLGMFQVTQGEYIAVMQENPSVFHGKNRPVEHVSWKEAVEFCTRLSAMPMEKAAGRVYRLPTEAEWEYACRAGSDTAFAFGDELTALQARFCEEIVCEPQPTMPVGMYPPNDWGLHDMHGNVWEWTSDWYALDYYANSPKSDPKGPPTGTHHVLRGGSASVKNFECRCAMRGESARDKPYAKSNARFEAIGDFGLRVVCEIRK